MFTVVSLLDSLGTGLYLAGGTVYFVQGVGLSPAQLGMGLALAGGAGFLATVPVGLLADRCGARPVLIGLQLWLAAAFTALAFVHGPLAFAAVCSLMTMAERSAPPMIQAVVADLMGGAEQVGAMARIRTVRNVGYALGALLATPLMAVHELWTFRVLLLGNAVSYVVAALLLRTVAVPRRAGGPAVPGPRRSRLPRGLGDRRFLAVTGLNGVLVLHQTMLNVGLPLWVVRHTSAPVASVPLLFALNTALVIGLQVRFSRDPRQEGRNRRSLRWAAWLLAATGVLMALSAGPGRAGALVLLVLAVGTLTAGELWQSIAGWALPVDHAPEGRRAEYLSVFNLGVTVQAVLGPLAVTAVVALGPRGWLLLTAVFSAAALLSAPVLRALERARPLPAVAPPLQRQGESA
ncbi:MFS transporter [Streptomyces lasalocidi]|uniref:MFS transporter n=1 Tax=Streptomyces sp. MUSC 14 TaxID=1354889 RepID=UPI0015A59132|nr:MFS transporter [Streptomyces sp. MUSC 14]